MSRARCSALARAVQAPRLTPPPTTVLRHSTRFTPPPFPSSRQVRYQSSLAGRFSGIRVKHLFLGVTSVGLFITIYGLVEWYFALDTWPEPVRTPLRKAIKAKNQKDYVKSEQYYQEAIEAARSLPSTALDPDPLLKLSGIYIAYAAILEEQNHNVQAYKQLEIALSDFGFDALDPEPSRRIAGEWAAGRVLDQEEHLRAIGLSQKLGDLALRNESASTFIAYHATDRGPKTWLDAAEYHLSGALSAMLRLGLSAPKDKRVVAGRDVSLPDGAVDDEAPGGRVDKRGLGVTMEGLAEVYAKKGQYALAGNLLIQAVSTLLPPNSPEQPPVRDRCQAALLMTTISSHALHPRTPSAIKASRSWSLRSLQISQEALKEDSSEISSMICQRASCVGYYNLGMLAETDGDLTSALEYFDKALINAREAGFLDGRRQVMEAIRRVRSTKGMAL